MKQVSCDEDLVVEIAIRYSSEVSLCFIAIYYASFRAEFIY